MASTQSEHYFQVWKDLQDRREGLETQIRKLRELEMEMVGVNAAIKALESIMPADAIPGNALLNLPAVQKPTSTGASTTPVPMNPRHSSSEIYGDMSVRWACLYFLTEHSGGPASTSVIAEALQNGGITSNGRSFSANVSAVLSNMNKERGEVESTPEGWIVTPHGRDLWQHIKAKRSSSIEESTPTA